MIGHMQWLCCMEKNKRHAGLGQAGRRDWSKGGASRQALILTSKDSLLHSGLSKMVWHGLTVWLYFLFASRWRWARGDQSTKTSYRGRPGSLSCVSTSSSKAVKRARRRIIWMFAIVTVVGNHCLPLFFRWYRMQEWKKRIAKLEQDNSAHQVSSHRWSSYTESLFNIVQHCSTNDFGCLKNFE